MYIDPGAGSILLQVAGAAAIAVLASFRVVKQSVKSASRRVAERLRGK